MATTQQDRGTDVREKEHRHSFPTTALLHIFTFLSAIVAALLFPLLHVLAALTALTGDSGVNTEGKFYAMVLLAWLGMLAMFAAAVLIVGRKLRVSIMLSAACSAIGFVMGLLFVIGNPSSTNVLGDLLALVLFAGPSLVVLWLSVLLRRRPDGRARQ